MKKILLFLYFSFFIIATSFAQNAKSSIENYTFMIFEENLPVAIVPLYIESIDSEWQISMGQEPIFAPIFIKTIDKSILDRLYHYLFSTIDALAEKFDCKLARFQYSPLLHNNSFQILRYLSYSIQN